MAPYLLLALGFALLVAGARGLVRGASEMARRFGLGELVIGLTVVAFGTSAPEAAVSIGAALSGQGGIAMGNVVGSNIFNVAVVLGISAIICPLAVHLKVLRQELLIMVGVSVLFTAMFLAGGLARWEGSLLVVGLVTYTVTSVRSGRREASAGPASVETSPPKLAPAVSLAFVVGGLVLLVVGARLMVDNAVQLARQFGIGESVIGLTIVAAGTSLPELATSLVAAQRRQTDIAIGNIIGSNIFNILGIAGAAALAAPIPRDAIGWMDLAAMLATSILLLPLMRSGFEIVRWEGVLLLSCFVLYLSMIWPIR